MKKLLGFCLVLALFSPSAWAPPGRPPSPPQSHEHQRDAIIEPRATTLNSARVQDQYFKEVLLNVEQAREESLYFAQQGKNWALTYLSLALAVVALVTGLSTAFQASKIYSKSVKIRSRISVSLAALATAASTVSLYLHNESDSFLKQNRDKYSLLSIDINEVISDFYVSLRAQDITEITILDPQKKQALIELDRTTGARIRELAKSYGSKYGINTLADVRRGG